MFTMSGPAATQASMHEAIKKMPFGFVHLNDKAACFLGKFPLEPEKIICGGLKV